MIAIFIYLCWTIAKTVDVDASKYYVILSLYFQRLFFNAIYRLNNVLEVDVLSSDLWCL